MNENQISPINRINECTHLAPIFRNPVTGAIFKGDCGNRQNCLGARNRFRREFRNRLEAVKLEPGRPLFLWTFTARSAYPGGSDDIDLSFCSEREENQNSGSSKGDQERSIGTSSQRRRHHTMSWEVVALRSRKH